jgi:aminoglycoside phosphotransferase (APT) family kinase protein
MAEALEPEIDAEVRRALPACGGVTRAEPLTKGHGHQSFVLKTRSNATLLLKIALRHDQLGKMKSLRDVLALTARHGIASPAVLAFSEGTASFDGRPWLIQEFLPGQDGEVALPGMSERERAAFFRDFGAAVARLHAIDVGYFSEDIAATAGEPTWGSLVQSRAERLRDHHLNAGLVPRKSIDRAHEVLLATVQTVGSALRPALVHRDLYLPNTLVEAGRFRCLLDFEHARSWDAVSDFVKLRMWVFDAVAGSAAAFWSGYGANPLTTPDGHLRYHVALGLELLSGLVYWRKTGDLQMFSDYDRRLRDWLTTRT